jgi:hypothetical protein
MFCLGTTGGSVVSDNGVDNYVNDYALFDILVY